MKTEPTFQRQINALYQCCFKVASTLLKAISNSVGLVMITDF